MSLTPSQVQHVAKLARLALRPEEEVLYQAQLSAILDAVEVLQKVDTSQIAPTAQVMSSDMGMRQDEVIQEARVLEKVLESAPATSGTHFSVPKIID